MLPPRDYLPRRMPRLKPPHIGEAEWQQMLADQRARDTDLDQRGVHVQERSLARDVDDGTGRCKHCGVALGSMTVSGQIYPLHPLAAPCARPIKCSDCGHEWTPAPGRIPPCPACANVPTSTALVRAADVPAELQPVRKQQSLFDE
jgi:hypothetical protein